MGSYRDFLSILLLLIATTFSLSQCNHRQEAHSIMRRMSEAGDVFEGHDVAHVMLVEGQGQRKRHLVKRDLRSITSGADRIQVKDLQLHLSSGSKVNLALKSAGIVVPDTEVAYLTPQGRVVGKLKDKDCYSYGQVKDTSGDGWAATSHCDGLFGFASSSGYEYFIHPVESGRTKRETNEEDYDVHVMWRRSAPQTNAQVSQPLNEDHESVALNEEHSDNKSRFVRASDSTLMSGDIHSSLVPEGNDDDRKGATGFVVELAMFSDAQYWQQLQRRYPGREDDFLLTRLAAAQALYSNREKVGYDVQIKVKLLEYWTVNPSEYTFENRLGRNLRSFCVYTRDKYIYDVHALNTGIVERPDSTVGLAYVRGACTQTRCFVALATRLNQFVGYAHELGHTLGMNHFDKCPDDMRLIGGFMGGGLPLNFSPCMKFQLDQFLATSRSNCLFRESGRTTTPASYSDLANLLPGQIMSPDALCKILAGPGYIYMKFGNMYDDTVCKWWTCFNDDETSPEFGMTKRFPAPTGFPCGDESFCVGPSRCDAWSMTWMSLEVQKLQNLIQTPEWSEWPVEFPDCSRSCGTGVKFRSRICQIKEFNLAPYCEGPRFQAYLCNTGACPMDPTSLEDLRQARKEEVCERLLRGGGQLSLRSTGQHRSNSSEVRRRRDINSIIQDARSPSCFVTCDGDIDAVMPDGTPCTETERSQRDLLRLNIQLRCVRGFCWEFSDCHERLQSKDECGVCGGDGSRCVRLIFGGDFEFPRRTRRTLTTIPAGSSNIEVYMERNANRYVVLELWDDHNHNIIGRAGRFPLGRYEGSRAIPFAGTIWSYNRSVSYLRAAGPTTENVVIRAFRGSYPVRKILMTYARSP